MHNSLPVFGRENGRPSTSLAPRSAGLEVYLGFSLRPRRTEASWSDWSGCIQLDAVVRQVVADALASRSFDKPAQLGQRLLFARSLEAHSVAAFTVNHGPATEPELFFRSSLTLDVASAAALEADTALNVGERTNMTVSEISLSGGSKRYHQHQKPRYFQIEGPRERMAFDQRLHTNQDL